MNPRQAPGNAKVLAASLTNERLHLVLMPTEACNFRCVYCYERFQHGRMEPRVVGGLKRLLTRRAAELRQLFLSWFGGEPLLAPDVIDDVMLHAGRLRKRHASLAVVSDITTNGYLLTPARARRLLDLGVTDYQIPFDGPRDWHDRKRVLRGGRGTFDRVWANLCALREQEGTFHVTIRLHLDRENELALPEFLDLVALEFSGDSRFELFVRPLSRFGGPNDGALATFATDEEARAAVARVKDLAVARGIRLWREPPGTPICLAARGNSFLVRADGTLNKCTIALEHQANQIGRLHADGTVEIDNSRVRPWLRGLFSGVKEELRCPMRGLADRVPEAGAGPMATGDRG